MKTKVMELMTENPVFVSPETTLKEAAQKMSDIDCGVLPVGTKEKLIGMITDRDIVIRAVAKGKDMNQQQVRDYMTQEAYACHEDDTLEEAAGIMCKHQVSRLIVKDKADKITGILSFGCMMREETDINEVCKVVECAIRKKAA